MSRYSSPRTPTDRDAARLADELRSIAQDDTRPTPRAEARRRLRLRLPARLRPAPTLRAPRAH